MGAFFLLSKHTMGAFLLYIIFLLALPLVCIGPCLYGDGGGNKDWTGEKSLGSITSISSYIIYLWFAAQPCHFWKEHLKCLQNPAFKYILKWCSMINSSSQNKVEQPTSCCSISLHLIIGVIVFEIKKRAWVAILDLGSMLIVLSEMSFINKHLPDTAVFICSKILQKPP